MESRLTAFSTGPLPLPMRLPAAWRTPSRLLFLAGVWVFTVTALIVAGAPTDGFLIRVTAAAALVSLAGLLFSPPSERNRVYLWSLLCLAAVGTLTHAMPVQGGRSIATELIAIFVVVGVVLGDFRAVGPGLRAMAAVGVALVTLALWAAESRSAALQAGLWAMTLLLAVAFVLRLQRQAADSADLLLDATRHAALTDPLSGLNNRRGWAAQAERVYAQAQRERRPLTVAMIDADHFKQLNDRYGHAAGDAAIRALADQVRVFTRRPLDVACRFGGEEFAVIWYDCGAEEGQALASQLRETIARSPVVHEGQAIAMTVSIGLAQLVPDEGQSLALALASADAALYAAKASGRNRVASKAYLPRQAA